MIKFYAPNDPYGCFSNFSRHEVIIYGHRWRTSEHPFQAMKFDPHRPDLVKHVWEQTSPGKAAREGRRRDLPLRADWNESPHGIMLGRPSRGASELCFIAGQPPGELLSLFLANWLQPDDGVDRRGVTAEPLAHRVKDVIMFEVVLAKFRQNADCKKTLLGTGTDVLIEDARDDPYWGWGSSMVGENKLGRILMAVRRSLQ